MNRLIAWPVAFARFWYRFIIGDDWTVAAAVAVGLGATALLVRQHVNAWWLVPLIVVVIVRVSVQRSARRTRA
jgi:hypothetical protein